MITILDGYVDEPTCLGVPPYISPYPRYIAGSILDAGEGVHYLTIDQLRINDEKVKLLYRSDVIVVIVGMAVPGRYLSSFPASPKELSFLNGLEKPIKILCGPAARHGFGISGGKKAFNSRELEKSFDLIIKGDPEIIINQLILERFNVDAVDPNANRDSAKEIRDFAIKGANIVKEHPNFPDYLIAEIETYRGCPRAITGGCSFCIEPLKGIPDFRPIKDIIDEIKALYNAGIKHFRIGNQPCIFSYMSEGVGELDFPKPNPEAIEKLFSGIRNVAPDLKTLHIDNANPGT
ncbi:MAG TPA: radical SAM protein, partial [Thermoplasmatales archaeon]|nr:radical SAM protein [Thermoplasmatales archaeon]